MLSDMPGERKEVPPPPGHIHIYVPDVDASYKKALAEGGTSLHPPMVNPDPNADDKDKRAGVSFANNNFWFGTAPEGKNGVPPNHNAVSPYLSMKDAPVYVDFISKLFDAETIFSHHHKDGRVHHIELKVGFSGHGHTGAGCGRRAARISPCALSLSFQVDDTVFMLSETMSKEGKSEAVASHIYVPDCRKTFAKALELGATAVDELKVQGGPDTDMRGGVRFRDLNLYIGTTEDVHKTWTEASPAKKVKA